MKEYYLTITEQTAHSFMADNDNDAKQIVVDQDYFRGRDEIIDSQMNKLKCHDPKSNTTATIHEYQNSYDDVVEENQKLEKIIDYLESKFDVTVNRDNF